MVHRVVGIGRGQPFIPDHQLASLPPFLLIRIEKAQNRGDRSPVAVEPMRAPALEISESFAKRFDGLAAVPVEAIVQFVSGGDQRCRRSSARLAGRVEDLDEAVVLAIPYAFNTSSDVGAIQTVERAMKRAARNAFFRAAPRRKHDMPVRTLVQAGKIILPNFMIPAEKPRYDLFGGFGLGNIDVHRNHRLRILPSGSV
jgi:hypothetical protein